ncbi:MAG: type IV pilus twitching motility protein PilT [Bifidobacteriaceae bacterium]|jgi:twitching motility protein PilT|nr:type IV pilus twitching motility protein PilT [Bifidobacteriaceae bacterium]
MSTPTTPRFDLGAILQYTADAGASDLHVVAGLPPGVRVHGALHPIPGHPVVGQDELYEALLAILTPNQRKAFAETLEMDFSHQIGPETAFRANLFWQKNTIGGAFRVIPRTIKTLEQLGIPTSLRGLAGLPRGLVLVCGPTGSGKSTTLAALIDIANKTRTDHIITIEDPIEFLHSSNRCVVVQREVGVDTHSFAAALKHALRQDPDIILVGEMRDKETMEIALRAAETGHLVFATIHTQDTGSSINRIIDEFPATQQDQIRTQLAGAIRGVVSQTLCPTVDGKGRVVATEIMLATPAVKTLIRDNRLHQLYSTIHSAKDDGMHTLDQSLAELVRNHEITYEVGLERARQVDEYNKLCGRSARMDQGVAAIEHAQVMH